MALTLAFRSALDVTRILRFKGHDLSGKRVRLGKPILIAT